jgi:hypothetical protein
MAPAKECLQFEKDPFGALHQMMQRARLLQVPAK